MEHWDEGNFSRLFSGLPEFRALYIISYITYTSTPFQDPTTLYAISPMQITKSYNSPSATLLGPAGSVGNSKREIDRKRNRKTEREREKYIDSISFVGAERICQWQSYW